jgi:hypothetical protein
LHSQRISEKATCSSGAVERGEAVGIQSVCDGSGATSARKQQINDRIVASRRSGGVERIPDL